VRELRNLVERAAVLSPGPNLQISPFTGVQDRRTSPPAARSDAAGSAAAWTGEEATVTRDNRTYSSPEAPHLTLADAERRHVRAALESCGWRVAGSGGATEMLGLKESTLRYRMRKHGIKRPE
jgi:transcriptional regulator with GAF, ATPase, and Fis domain